MLAYMFVVMLIRVQGLPTKVTNIAPPQTTITMIPQDTKYNLKFWPSEYFIS